MWPSSPARAWARRASMVSSIPDSFSVRSALSSAPGSIVVTMMAVPCLVAAGRGGRRGAVGVMTPASVPQPARSGTTLPAAANGSAANSASGPCRNAAAPPSPAGAAAGESSVPAARMPLTVR